MSKVSREAKCLSLSTACAGQMSAPVQRRTESSRPVLALTSRTAWLPHAGQIGRKLVGHGVRRPPREIDVDDLRDDVAGPLHGDGVADADVLAVADRLAVRADALDVVLVVERGVDHDDAADRDRLEAGDGSERTGTADLDVDAAEDGLPLLGRELVGDRPARAARNEAEPRLQVEPVDLVDDAVDVVVEPGAVGLERAVEVERLADVPTEPHARIGGQAPFARRS